MIRCAIYTRKSHEEGLEQEFNSLDAQRLSAENYIKSQQHEGWQILPKYYDDGGFSGGTLERPALKELFDDIAAGLIDCVIVYKIDRLSRSLLDFTKIVDLFDRHNVTFVSVTQSFNTASSMGRLMLNVLLSFAQYERELTGERIRDKFAASKQKGMWMGGNPPLGYDIIDRKLVINAPEAKLIEHIFTRFLVLASATHLAKELNNDGYHSKQFTAKTGKDIGGARFTKASLRRILTNPVYVGKIRHKDKEFAGLHDAIIDQDLWDRAQATFKTAPKRNSAFCKSPVLLKGIIHCQACNIPMTPTYTAKKNRQYRYYACSNVLRGIECHGIISYLAAGEVEHFVIQQVRHVLKSPEVAAQTTLLLENAGLDKTQVFDLLKDIDAVWQNLFPIEQQKIIHTLIRAVYVSTEGIDVRINQYGLQSLIIETQDKAITV
jgi:site-specific DNA recombinase